MSDDFVTTGDAGVEPDAGSTIDTSDTGPSDTPSQAARRRRLHPVLEWLLVIGVALLAALLIRTFVVQQFQVSGTSMLNTLHHKDRVLVNKLSYRLHDPRRGDVIVLKTIEGAGERDLIKRVIGLPGETIEYRDCQIFINGRLLEEPYLDPQIVTPTSCGSSLAPTLVEAKHVFVLGDNRGGSKDSRAAGLGQIKYSDILGRAFVVIWPSSNWQWL